MANDGRLLLTALAVFCGLSVPPVSLGREADFSGNWVLKDRTSVTGTDFANGIPDEIKLIQMKDAITLERLTLEQNGAQVTVSETLSFDGVPLETVTEKPHRHKSTALKWATDKKSFTEFVSYPSEYDGQTPEETITEVWALSNTGKTLTLFNTHQSAQPNPLFPGNDNWSMRGVYEKERERPATAEGIKFKQGLSWKEVLAKAKAEHKYIFLDAYATWCVPCKGMDKNVYSNPRVGSHVNGLFIAVKVQMDKTPKDSEEVKSWYADAKALEDKYNLKAVPVFLFFSPNGKLVHRAQGYKTPYEFIALTQDAVNLNKQYYTLIENYRNGTRNYAAMPYLIKAAEVLGEEELTKTLARDYIDHHLTKMSEEELLNRNTLELMASNISGSQDRIFTLCYQEGAKVDETMGERGYSQGIVDAVIYREEIEPKLWKSKGVELTDKPDWKGISSTIAGKYDNGYAERALLDAKIGWYQAKKDWSQAAKYCLDKLDKYGADADVIDAKHAVEFNQYTWFIIFEHVVDKGILERAAQWQKKLLNVNVRPDDAAMLLDTYANLLYKAGRTEEGIDWEKKAMELEVGYAVKRERNPSKVFQETFEKMQKGAPTWGT